MTREALLVTHVGRPDTVEQAARLAERLESCGFRLRVLEGEAAQLGLESAQPVGEDAAADGVEIVIALGGDGTLLRAAELARPHGKPLLGVNLGRVAFLAEAEVDAMDQTVHGVAEQAYKVDERLTVDVAVRRHGEVVATGWALNEATVEKASRERMLEVLVGVDGRPLSRWGCDGVVCATPTGSTAYAFSAGGPVVWPEVEALLLVPISAHALFSRALVVAPTSVLTIEVVADGSPGVLCCDGRRTLPLDPGMAVEVRRGRLPVRVVRLHPTVFTDRLVAKFHLPVDGWRGRGL
ncbi:MAG: NAD kinase [Actinomycetota bacterium]|nr:NAD kinase [Actinomycetota bacterium]